MRTRTLLFVTVALCACGVIVFAGVYASKRKPPRLLAHTDGLPRHPRRIGDDWFWIEQQERGPQRLVRVHHGTETVIATAQQIVGFDAAAGVIAWTQRDGRFWSVCAKWPGAGVRTLAKGLQPIGTPCIWNGRVFWPETVLGPAPSSPIPALQSSVRVTASGGGSLPASAGTRPAASLLPVPKADLVGTDGRNLYAVATEGAGIQTMAVYAIPGAGGEARRIAGDTAIYSAVAIPGKGVAWAGPSAECSDPSTVAEVHLADPTGHVRTLGVWLPAPGELFTASGRLWFVDATPSPKVWPADTGLQLVQPIALPPDTEALAVGADEVLLRPSGAHGRGADVYVLRL
ncbi:MAG: hypothetical protein ACP5VE_12000 [Chthonomonadales bacterium]